MDHKITRLSSFHIIGLQFRGNNDNNACPKLWESFSKRILDIKPLAKEPINAFGVCSDCDMENNIFTYTAGLEVSDISSVPPEMVSLEIPEQVYAVFACTLPTLITTLDEIYKKWLPKSDYLRSQGPEFELYDSDFDPEDSQSPMYIYVPVIKK